MAGVHSYRTASSSPQFPARQSTPSSFGRTGLSARSQLIRRQAHSKTKVLCVSKGKWRNLTVLTCAMAAGCSMGWVLDYKEES